MVIFLIIIEMTNDTETLLSDDSMDDLESKARAVNIIGNQVG